MPEWHASFLLPGSIFLLPALLTLVVKHADIKTKNVENRRNRFYICVFYHQQLHNCDCISAQIAYIP